MERAVIEPSDVGNYISPYYSYSSAVCQHAILFTTYSPRNKNICMQLICSNFYMLNISVLSQACIAQQCIKLSLKSSVCHILYQNNLTKSNQIFEWDRYVINNFTLHLNISSIAHFICKVCSFHDIWLASSGSWNILCKPNQASESCGYALHMYVQFVVWMWIGFRWLIL